MKKCLCLIIMFVLLTCVCYAENVSDEFVVSESTKSEISPGTENTDENENEESTEDDESSENIPADEEDIKDDSESEETDEPENKEKEYEKEFLSAEDAYELYNIQDYAPDDSEKETIYDTENIMRRDGISGEAYVVFEIPYVSEFKAISCHRQTDVAEFTFMYSKDGEEWEVAETEVTEITDENKWTRLEYVAENIQGIKYVKVIWGEEKESVHWWNPYFVGLFANTGESVPEKIEINIEDEIFIPMYDSILVKLDGKILDQIDNGVTGEIIWNIEACEDERIVILEENAIEIFSDMENGLEITLGAEAEEYGLSAVKTVKLCAAMPGDADKDGILTEADIDAIIENYGAEADIDNRLCDVDKNGKIDVVDLAYVARYAQN